MNRKDGWFLGLLAMVYLYLDSSLAPRLMSEDAHAPLPADPEPRLLPARVVPRDVCPRNHLHPVALRADGAMWCRGCDEAFYPQAAIWGSIMSGVAA